MLVLRALSSSRRHGLRSSAIEVNSETSRSHGGRPSVVGKWGFLRPGVSVSWALRFGARSAGPPPAPFSGVRGVRADETDGLSTWARRWHLTDRWCLVLARDTARWYAINPDAQGWEFQGQGIFVGSFPFAIEPLQLGPFYHDPTWRGRGDFKADVLEHVRHALDDYCDRIEADALAAGLKRAPRKRGLEHFDWLGLYQVKGESFASIAKSASYRFEGGRQTVRKAIIELAKYLQLTLRPST
jgi:GNAT superfamily N-acetyltransferase